MPKIAVPPGKQLTDELQELRGDVLALQLERDRLRLELQAAVIGNAKVIRALDAALQWGEALFAFMPEGMILPEGVKTAKGALSEALKDIRR